MQANMDSMNQFRFANLLNFNGLVLVARERAARPLFDALMLPRTEKASESAADRPNGFVRGWLRGFLTTGFGWLFVAFPFEQKSCPAVQARNVSPGIKENSRFGAKFQKRVTSASVSKPFRAKSAALQSGNRQRGAEFEAFERGQRRSFVRDAGNEHS